MKKLIYLSFSSILFFLIITSCASQKATKQAVGDVEIKTYLANILNVFLDPIREKRAYFESNMNLVEDALDKGVSNARISANETMELVRDKMKVSTYKKIW